MGEKPLVQPAECLPERSPHHEAGAAAPEYIGGLIILAMVLLHMLHEAAAAERIAVLVQKASGRAGILKRIPLVVGNELGTTGAAVRVGVHPLHQGMQPVPGNFDVGVDEDKVLCLYLCQGPVVAARKAVILIQLDEADIREHGFHEGDGVVVGSVVGHNDLRVQAFAGSDEPGQELAQVIPCVVIEYDNCGFHALKSISAKASVGMSLLRHGRASSAATRSLFHRSRKLPVMSISRTGCTFFPSFMRKPSMP